MIKLEKQLEVLEYDVIKTNKKIQYIDLPCGFDIETTSLKVGETKTAFMYVWMLGIGHNTPIHYGRTWEEFQDVITTISDSLELTEDKRLVIYVHNLGYEFQFMRHYFDWLEVFAVGERKPIKAVTTQGIEFRDSYILSGFSLANTAKNLVTHNIEKMVGDLDYSLIRHHNTPLSDKELGYCDNDIHIITAYIAEQMAHYGNIAKIPMTNTGRVRTHVRNECYYSKTTHRRASQSKYKRYRKVMEDLTLDTDTYIQLKRGFMGGFTHANANHSGKTLKDVTSIDFTSAYPSVMVSEKFPMTKFKLAPPLTLDQFHTLCIENAVIFDVRFINIKQKITQETYLSESKCSTLINPVINNGRVNSADELSTTLTEIDLEIMNQCYEWEGMQLGEVRYARKDYLPKAIIKSILDLYQDKTELKDVAGYEVEYLLSKGMLNSIYGMSVTDIAKDQATYDNGWSVEPIDIDETIGDYNESKNRFLYYPWGLWVTAYARLNLWTGILAVGDDYVYSDTDSLKILNYNQHKDYIEWFDSQILEKMNLMCDTFKFNRELLHPKTKEGHIKTLGIWDYEGTYPLFKTIGAKRYLVLDRGELHLTVAGLSKQNGIEYMLELCGGDKEEVFNIFNDALYIPADRTGKMTHTYIDNEFKFKVCDYLGNEATVNPLSGIHLESCDFTLSIATQYKDFLKSLSNGYIFNGVNHI